MFFWVWLTIIPSVVINCSNIFVYSIIAMATGNQTKADTCSVVIRRKLSLKTKAHIPLAVRSCNNTTDNFTATTVKSKYKNFVTRKENNKTSLWLHLLRLFILGVSDKKSWPIENNLSFSKPFITKKI